jgi:hypothetical protein
MFLFLFIFIAIVLVVFYLLLPAPPGETGKKLTVDDFTWPTNSNARSIPILYGAVWMHGNTLENSGGYYTSPIKA